MSDNTVSSLSALTHEYRTIAHNLANANTVGFKRRISVFTEGEPTGAAPASGPAAPPAGAAKGRAGRIRGKAFVDFSQGRVIETRRPLDVSLHGKGFFVVETDKGERYTRNGVLRLNGQRQLVDAKGRTVAGEGGPITVPPNVSPVAVEIAQDGRISAGEVNIGKLRIVEFEDPKTLTPVGDCTFRASKRAKPAPVTNTTVQQGFQEASNVSPVNELVALIKVTRLYEANVKIIQAKGDRGKDLMRVAMA